MTQELKAPDFSDRYLAPREIVADRFEAGEKIGEGPFGQVYRAQDMLIEAEVALKVYGDDLMKNPLHEERFLKATRRARALTQKNVVRLHDGNIHNGHPWVSMQYLEGLNLRKVVGLRQKREESFGIAEIEPILAQITLALQHVGRDHPHGDLKPENIILMPDLIKVTDSYLMSAIPDDAFRKGNKDSAFVAPELLDAQAGEADARCDVYSVGAIIGLLLFGEDYQPGSAKDAPGGMAAVDALCRRAMAFDRNERYGSVEALAEDFTAIVDTGSLLNQDSTPARSVPKPPAPKPKSTTPAQGEPAAVAAASALAAEASDAATTPDPLDVETAPDIGMPLEDDLPTEEYDREEHAPELADMLPTNEVDRDQFPVPKSEPAAASAPRQETTEKEAPAEQEEAPEAAAAKPPSVPVVDKPSADESTTTKKDKSAGNRSGRRMGLAAIVIGILFLIGLIGAGLMATVFSEDEQEAPQEQARAQEVEQDEQEPAADEVEEDDADEAENARAKAEAQRLAAVGEAVVAAIAGPMAALEGAEEAAQSEAEALEEAQEEEAQQAAGGENDASGSASGSSGGRAAAPATNCPSDMVRVTGGGQNVCLDAYQYPGRGRMPEVNVSWFDARRLCGQQDKRLCTQQEWRAGCGGSYPYGSTFDADRCNTVDADGFGRMPTETGSFPRCRSRAGAYDMSGNVFEWVADERVVGGDSDSGADMATCSYSSAMSPSSSRGNVGFRCCTDPT